MLDLRKFHIRAFMPTFMHAYPDAECFIKICVSRIVRWCVCVCLCVCVRVYVRVVPMAMPKPDNSGSSPKIPLDIDTGCIRAYCSWGIRARPSCVWYVYAEGYIDWETESETNTFLDQTHAQRGRERKRKGREREGEREGGRERESTGPYHSERWTRPVQQSSFVNSSVKANTKCVSEFNLHLKLFSLIRRWSQIQLYRLTSIQFSMDMGGGRTGQTHIWTYPVIIYTLNFVVIGRHCVHVIHSLLKRPATLDLSMDVSCFGLKMCSIFCVLRVRGEEEGTQKWWTRKKWKKQSLDQERTQEDATEKIEDRR